MKHIIVTGCAGFIGFHVAKKLLEEGDFVIGIDNLNAYYDVGLKKARLSQLEPESRFTFYQGDITDQNFINDLFLRFPNTSYIVHLAAQAGVRYSLINPYSYAHTNVVGHVTLLEASKSLKNLQHFVYASSSSVYGANQKMPFSIDDPVNQPISLYAASKRACELISYSYAHLFNIPQTGLRYFTVYGPWGRPDMAPFLFTKGILADQEITVFNQGDMRRNFTYIDDVVKGTINCLYNPPDVAKKSQEAFRLYNIGNNRSENLMDFIRTLETLLQKKANICFQPLQPGDVKDTIADINESQRDFSFHPQVDIKQGLEAFIKWYRDYYKV